MEFEYNFLHHFARAVACRMPIPVFYLYDIANRATQRVFEKKVFISPWFVFEVSRYPFFEYLGAFQPLPLGFIPRYEEKRFMWPCSELLWLCLSHK